jgi:hypothetical protein
VLELPVLFCETTRIEAVSLALIVREIAGGDGVAMSWWRRA